MSYSPFDDSPLTVTTIDGATVRVDLNVLAEAWTQRLLKNRDAVDNRDEEVHPNVVYTHANVGWIFTAQIQLEKDT